MRFAVGPAVLPVRADLKADLAAGVLSQLIDSETELIASGRAHEIESAMRDAGTRVTRIGKLTAGSGVQVLRRGESFDPGGAGYRHF